MAGDFSAWHTSARIARIAQRRAPHRIPRQSLGSQLPGVLRDGLPSRSQVPAIGTAVRFRSIVPPAISRMTKRQAAQRNASRRACLRRSHDSQFWAHRQERRCAARASRSSRPDDASVRGLLLRTLKGCAFLLNGNQVPAYCTRALTLAGGTSRVAHAPFDARCVLAGGPATIENVAHAQLDSQEKVLRLVRQFFPMGVRALAGSGFRDTSSFEPSVRSRSLRYGSTPRPMRYMRLATKMCRPAWPSCVGSGALPPRPCAPGPSLQEPTTDRLWKEFAVRSVPTPQKTDHRQTVEGARS